MNREQEVREAAEKLQRWAYKTNNYGNEAWMEPDADGDFVRFDGVAAFALEQRKAEAMKIAKMIETDSKLLITRLCIVERIRSDWDGEEKENGQNNKA